ncbi:MAG: hypothetical protein H8J66_03375 [Nitrospira sp.]|nr:hypothetical protein [Nitrospira sp.]
MSIFAFDDVAATNLSIFGTRTLGVLSKGNIAFTGMIDLLGNGGFEMGAIRSLAMKDLSALGNGGRVSGSRTGRNGSQLPGLVRLRER